MAELSPGRAPSAGRRFLSRLLLKRTRGALWFWAGRWGACRTVPTHVLTGTARSPEDAGKRASLARSGASLVERWGRWVCRGPRARLQRAPVGAASARHTPRASACSRCQRWFSSGADADGGLSCRPLTLVSERQAAPGSPDDVPLAELWAEPLGAPSGWTGRQHDTARGHGGRLRVSPGGRFHVHLACLAPFRDVAFSQMLLLFLLFLWPLSHPHPHPTA